MSRRRGIANSVSESAPMADSAIIFENPQLLTPGNGLHATDSATARSHRSRPPVPIVLSSIFPSNRFYSTPIVKNVVTQMFSIDVGYKILFYFFLLSRFRIAIHGTTI